MKKSFLLLAIGFCFAMIIAQNPSAQIDNSTSLNTINENQQYHISSASFFSFFSTRSNTSRKDGSQAKRGRGHTTNLITITQAQTPLKSHTKSRGNLAILPANTKCQLIKKGFSATKNGITDYWYKVKHNQKVGWVFGAYTSLADNSNPTFRLFGNEPSWLLTMTSDKILLSMGSNSYEFPYVAPVITSDRWVYTSSNSNSQTIRVTVVRGNCEDDMSGEVFPYSSLIEMNGTYYHGCGE